MAKQKPHGLILAGGRGTRFWPRSRARRPKQLLPLFGEGSLLRQTVERLRPAIPPERIWILTNDELLRSVRRELPDVPANQVIAEPVQRNTAPCLAVAAHAIHSIDPDALLGVFPADHYIEDAAGFRKLLNPAFAAAQEGKLATIGIQPRWAETGYGYLEFPRGSALTESAPVPVVQFCEKPDEAKAKRFLKAGRYYWNAGMFFWRADVFLDAMRRYLPRTASVLAYLPSFDHRRFLIALRESFPLCENISVDFGVMEHAAKDRLVVGVPSGDIGWNDLGSWKALYELSTRDQAGNVLRTSALAHAASGCYVEAPGKTVALVGVDNLVVVDTPDALLVMHRDSAQQVGEIVKMLVKQNRTDLF